MNTNTRALSAPMAAARKFADGLIDAVAAETRHPGTRLIEAVVYLREGVQYGAPVYKPGCPMSEGFAAIARTTTITPATIARIKAMGFQVRVLGKPEVEL